MDRFSFIKNLGLVAGVSTLPVKWVKVYDKFYLLQCFVAGFTHYHGPENLEHLREGEIIQLVREPDNKYDAEAIALHWNGLKIGFIPARYNFTLARLIDIQIPELHAEITHIKTESAPWENVAVAIYCLKERVIGSEIPTAARPLAVLETPKYRSLKTSRHAISRIERPSEEEKLVININRLPAGLEQIRKKYSAINRSGDNWFGDDGLRILDEEDIEKLLPQVKEVKSVINTLNQSFTEIIFDIENCAA
jgi:hypothetical protein